MSQKLVVVRKKPSAVIIIKEDHGGFKGGYCFACDAFGWVHGLGYPYRAKGVLGNQLKHKKQCPMNRVLDDEGYLKHGGR